VQRPVDPLVAALRVTYPWLKKMFAKPLTWLSGSEPVFDIEIPQNV